MMRISRLALFTLVVTLPGLALATTDANIRRKAFRKRLAAAGFQTTSRPFYDIGNNANSDEEDVADYAGSFTKCLEHSSCSSTVTSDGANEFEQLLLALESKAQSDFNNINRYPSARKFVNPQAAWAYTMEGCPTQIIEMTPPPSITSKKGAAELIEVYLQAICRNVKFKDYGTGECSDYDPCDGQSITWKAASVLTDFDCAYTGPKNCDGDVTPSLLFRGNCPGTLVGPYISQFLFVDLFPFASSLVKHKQHVPIAQNREFGVAWDDFIAIQNGLIPANYDEYDFEGECSRYIITGRDLGTWVHNDYPYEAFYNAITILHCKGFPLSPALPYQNGDITDEAPFSTMGMPDAFGMIGQVTLEALKAAWAQKWLATRNLRPEAFAGLVHKAESCECNPYNIHNSMFEDHNSIDVLNWVKKHNQKQADLEYNALCEYEASTYLLGQMYPEGSPVHPATPSGHAAIAGACITVIKAIYNDQTLIKTKFDPVKPSPCCPKELTELDGEGECEMTVGSELDKLAYNIGMGRNFAGIHYRVDIENGIKLGEQVAIHYLQDHARTYQEQTFTGYELTKCDGTRIRITATAVIPLVT